MNGEENDIKTIVETIKKQLPVETQVCEGRESGR